MSKTSGICSGSRRGIAPVAESFIRSGCSRWTMSYPAPGAAETILPTCNCCAAIATARRRRGRTAHSRTRGFANSRRGWRASGRAGANERAGGTPGSATPPSAGSHFPGSPIIVPTQRRTAEKPRYFAHNNDSQRSRASSIYSSDISIPMLFRPAIFAAYSVVPVPQNGSMTTPPGGQVAKMGMRHRSTG